MRCMCWDWSDTAIIMLLINLLLVPITDAFKYRDELKQISIYLCV